LKRKHMNNSNKRRIVRASIKVGEDDVRSFSSESLVVAVAANPFNLKTAAAQDFPRPFQGQKSQLIPTQGVADAAQPWAKI